MIIITSKDRNEKAAQNITFVLVKGGEGGRLVKRRTWRLGSRGNRRPGGKNSASATITVLEPVHQPAYILNKVVREVNRG